MLVVSIINQGSSRDEEAMHLLKCLAFITAKLEFFIFATHFRGIDNILADALSRDNFITYVHWQTGNQFLFQQP